MADKTITERLQPSLLDRLTDHEPGVLTERREERVIDVRRLRDIMPRARVMLTRTGDTGVSLEERCALANAMDRITLADLWRGFEHCGYTITLT